ncbi:MAG: helix-turn-helix transcriptional regulator [Lachnospiraceae bacterium]|nr:helix-turn-helix transcriptional regulator [Lachnospiraceae bacterium]
MENISLEQLAGLANLSVSHFCKYFKTVIHKAPIDYINYYRIECACHLLSSTRLSVTEIAYQVGYNDSGYFIRRFKKSKGVTPLQYRELYK